MQATCTLSRYDEDQGRKEKGKKRGFLFLSFSTDQLPRCQLRC
jgi:hypothetical protein